MENKRNVREEMKILSGGQFKEWYESLSKEEKIEYTFILENLKNSTLPKEETIEVDLGKAINFWIDTYGSFNLDTPKEKIINFYLKNQ
jgi:hypothetical protein